MDEQEFYPEKGELIAYTLQMDVARIRNKLSSIYMSGVQDPKTEYFEGMLIRAEKRLKDQIENDRKIKVIIDLP